VLLGLGMACGHGNLGMACVGAGLVALLLLALDLFSRAVEDAAAPDLSLLSGLKGAA